MGSSQRGWVITAACGTAMSGDGCIYRSICDILSDADWPSTILNFAIYL